MLIRIPLALQRLGIDVELKLQKLICLYSAYLIYGDKGFQGTTREWLTNGKMDFPRCKESYKFLISKIHIDPDFSWTYKDASNLDKLANLTPVAALEKLGDTISQLNLSKVRVQRKQLGKKLIMQ
jgi:hypothetical protein